MCTDKAGRSVREWVAGNLPDCGVAVGLFLGAGVIVVPAAAAVAFTDSDIVVAAEPHRVLLTRRRLVLLFRCYRK